jgi:hypothetical protein
MVGVTAQGEGNEDGHRMSRPSIDEVATFFADLARALGVREDATAEAAELKSLIDAPWSAYRSQLSESGAPLEISVQVRESGEWALRYIVDVADQSRDLAGNLGHYFDTARAISGVPDSVLKDLFDRHLGGAPPGSPARMMLGVAPLANRRRSTLYFPTSWMTLGQMVERAPEVAAAVSLAHQIGGEGMPAATAIIGYDLEDGRVARWKSYSWISDISPQLVERWPTLAPAALLDRELGGSMAAAQRRRKAFLQLQGERARVQFFASAYGWRDEAGVGRLLGFLDERLRTDLRPLPAVRDMMDRHRIAMVVGLVAVGSDALTYYFWPE